jgi:ubiquitin C-terminal hydrolase
MASPATTPSDSKSEQDPNQEFRSQTTALLKNISIDETDSQVVVTELHDLVVQCYKGELPAEQAQHFVADVLLRAVRSMMSRTYQQESDTIDLVMTTLQRVMDLALSRLDEDLVPLLDALNVALDDSQELYKNYGMEQLTTEELDVEDTPELQEFRKSIDFSQWVDVWTNGKWKPAQVVEVAPDVSVESQDNTTSDEPSKPAVGETDNASMEPNSVRVSFRGGDDAVTEVISRDSLRLAPLNSRSRSNIEPWRLELTKDSKVDAVDTVKKWYYSTVLEVKHDQLLVHYDGWGSRYDEWLPRTSARLAEWKSLAKGGRESGGVSVPTSERRIEDAEDPDDVCALFRGKDWSSYFIVVNTNYFDEQGGYDKVLSRIESKESLSIRPLRALVDSLTRNSNVLARPFVAKIAVRLRDAAFETVEAYSDKEVRELSKDHLDAVVQGVSRLMKRTNVKQSDSQGVIDRFILHTALMRLQSSNVERRINGMTALSELVERSKKAASPNSRTTIKPEEMIKWITENEVLETVFHADAHSELMKRSADILKFFATQNHLQTSHMALVWSSMERALKLQDQETLKVLFKLLDDISFRFDAPLVNYLFDKIGLIPFEEYVVATVDLIKQLGAATFRAGAEVAEKSLHLLWAISQDESKAPSNIASHALSKLEEALCGISHRTMRVPYIERCVENLRNRRSVVQSLQLIRKVVDVYPMRPSASEEETKWNLIAWLQEHLGIIDHMFAELGQFKESARKQVADRDLTSEQDIDGMLMSFHMNYRGQVGRRLSFLHFILSHSTLTLTQEQVDTVWKLCYTEALTRNEREICLNWLKNGVDQEADYTMFDGKVCEHLFEKMTSGIDVNQLSEAGYDCIERYFVHLNRATKKLFFPDGEKEFVVVDHDLDGFSIIWRIALDSTNERVMKPCIAFLIKLYENVADELLQKVGALRQEYIAKCMSHFKDYVDDSNYDRVERILLLLNSLLDASEVKGVGSLRSHGAQVRGRPVTLRIDNSVPRSQYAKKFELKIREHDSVWEIRETLGKKLTIAADSVRIFTQGRELKADQNGKKFSELKLKMPVTLVVIKSASSDQYVDLTRDNELVPRLKKALSEMHAKFANKPDGSMSGDDMATYILSCGAGKESIEEQRMRQIFEDFGDYENDSLDTEGFFQFYTAPSRARPEAVWSDLSMHGYREDLRHESEWIADEKNAAAQGMSLPRAILSSTDEYFAVLFEALNIENESIASSLWSLLQRLPTNPAMRHDLVSLELVTSTPNPDWNSLLDSRSAYKLLYSLQIIESLTDSHPVDASSNSSSTTDSKNAAVDDKKQDMDDAKTAVDAAGTAQAAAPSPATTEEEEAAAEELRAQAEEKEKWRRKFLLSGGFKHLYSILTHHREFQEQNALPGLENTRHNCLALLTKMLRTFVAGAIAVNSDMLDRLTQIRDESAVIRDTLARTSGSSAGSGGASSSSSSSSSSSTSTDSATATDFGGEMDEFDQVIAAGFAGDSDDDDDLMTQAGGDPVYGPHIPDAPPVTPRGRTNAVTYAGPLTYADALGSNMDNKHADGGDDATAAANEAEAADRRHLGLRTLVRQMSHGFANSLLEFIDFNQLQKTALELIEQIATQDASSSHQRMTVDSLCGLWVAILVYQPADLLPDLFNYLKDSSVLLQLLHSKASSSVRHSITTALFQICKHCDVSAAGDLGPPMQAPRAFFLKNLLESLPSGKDKSLSSHCEEHFWLVSQLLKEAMRGDDVDATTFEPLLKRLIEQAKQHVTSELNESDPTDQVLVGVMHLIHTLLREPSFRVLAGSEATGNLVYEIFYNFLFAPQASASGAGSGAGATVTEITTAQEEEKLLKARADTHVGTVDPHLPKCKTKCSRAGAFRVLVRLCEDTPENHARLMQYVKQQENSVSKLTAWGYNPEKHLISPTGLVGLRNLGATCYMNSLLQQFFMMPALRYGMLMADDASDDKKESLLYQLQTMFAFMSFSQKQAYDSSPFCYSYKDYGGQPVDVRVQQDVQEFFNVFTDRLEQSLKGGPQANLFKHLLGGKMVNQMICQGGCEEIRQRDEDYYTVSLEVKNHDNLEQSLLSYVTGELLSGVSCPACHRKTDTVKRVVLGKLPNTVAFHLKRFELDFNTFQHVKINSRFEFPMEVDLEPYTAEGLARIDAEAKMEKLRAAGGSADGKNNSDGKTEELVVPERYAEHPKEYYTYRVKGIIVHSGTAQGGHYYSFIQQRDGSQQWHRHDDKRIAPFDLKDMALETFGGGAKSDGENSRSSALVSSGWLSEEAWRAAESMRNAYMLFYERVDQTAGDGIDDEDEEEQEQQQETVAAADATQTVSDAGATPISNINKMVAAEEKAHRKSTNADMALIEEAARSGRNLRELVPARIMQAIEEDNAQFMTDRQIYNPDYFRFVSDMVKATVATPVDELNVTDEKQNPDLSTIQFATRFALDTLARSGENSIYPEFVGHLKALLETNASACQWFLQDMCMSKSYVQDLILVCRDHLVRKGFLDLCVVALRKVYPLESDTFTDVDESATSAASGSSKLVALSARFGALLMEMVDEAPKNWTRFADFWQLIFEFASLGELSRKMLIENRFITRLGDMFLGADSPVANQNKKPVSMGNRIVQPDFNFLLRTLSVLVRGCSTDTSDEKGSPPSQLDGEVVPCDEVDRSIILCPALCQNALKHAHSPSSIGEMISHWTYENLELTESILKILLDGIDRANHDTVGPYWEVVRQLAGIDDSIRKQRLNSLFDEHRGVLYIMHFYKNNHDKYCYVSIKQLMSIIDENEFFAQYMLSIRERWTWIDSWLKTYTSRRVTYAPALVRQKSGQQTFSRYQAQIERLGVQLDFERRSANRGLDSDDGDADPGNDVDVEGGGENDHPRPGVDSDDNEDDDNVGVDPPLSAEERASVRAMFSGIDDATDPGLADMVVHGSAAGFMPGPGAIVPAGPVISHTAGPQNRRSNTPVPTDDESTQDDGQDWTCGVCTLVNKSNLTFCDVCDSPKP